MNNNVTYIKQDYYWKPKANILTGVRDENNDIQGEDKVAESGYKLVSGDFITTKTVIVSKVSDITIWYIFTPGWENALEGRVKVITSKGHPWPDYGDYRIFAPDEFLEDKNPVQYIMEKDSPEDGIPVGLIGRLTQEGNFISDDYLNGVLCYLKEINKQGGINGRKLSYFVESADYENNEAIEESVLNLLNEKNICVLAGGRVGQEPREKIQELKIPFITVTNYSKDSDINNIKLAGDYIFRNAFVSNGIAAVAAHYAVEGLSAATARVLHPDSHSDYYEWFSTTFKNTFISMGGEVIGSEEENTEVDVLFISGGSTFIKDTAREQGQSAKTVLSIGTPWEYDPLMWSRVRMQTVNFFSVHAAPQQSEADEFLRSYFDRYDEEPNSIFALGYEAGMIIADALKRAQSTERSEIKDMLAETRINSFGGEFLFDEGHNPIRSYSILEWDGDGVTVIGTVITGL